MSFSGSLSQKRTWTAPPSSTATKLPVAGLRRQTVCCFRYRNNCRLRGQRQRFRRSVALSSGSRRSRNPPRRAHGLPTASTTAPFGVVSKCALRGTARAGTGVASPGPSHVIPAEREIAALPPAPVPSPVERPIPKWPPPGSAAVSVPSVLSPGCEPLPATADAGPAGASSQHLSWESLPFLSPSFLIDDFPQNYFFSSSLEVVHDPHPAHLVVGFQFLVHAFPGGHIRNHPVY